MWMNVPKTPQYVVMDNAVTPQEVINVRTDVDRGIFFIGMVLAKVWKLFRTSTEKMQTPAPWKNLILILDVNECSKDPTICGDKECINIPGSYRCQEKCLEGFIRDESGYCKGLCSVRASTKNGLELSSINTLYNQGRREGWGQGWGQRGDKIPGARTG